MSELATRTPSDIDAELNRLYAELAQAEASYQRYTKLAEADETPANKVVWYLDKASEWAEVAVESRKLIAPLQDEYIRRGMWTRYWLVTNSNGHVHDTTHCTTTYASTSFAWLTHLSGTDREDLVELAGEKACTVCFPDAPVETRNRPSRVKTPEQEAKAAEKAQKAAAKAASEVVVEDYRDGSRRSTKSFKTVRAATNEIASTLSSMVGYGPTHPTFDEWQSNVTNIIDALVAKGEVVDGSAYLVEALAKARKKCIAEHKKFMASATAKMYREQGILDPAADQPGYTPVKY